MLSLLVLHGFDSSGCGHLHSVGDCVRTEYLLRVDFKERVEIVQDVCRTKYFFVWYTSAGIYHLISLLVAAAKVKTISEET